MLRKPIRLLLSLLVLLCAGRATGQSFASMKEAVLLPPTFYVGDRVELRLRLAVGGEMRLEEPAELPEDPWVLVEGVRIEELRRGRDQGEALIRIFLRTYKPGLSRIPDLSLGDLRLSGLQVQAASVLEGRRDLRLRGLRPQLTLPFTGVRLAASLLVALGAPAAGLALLLRALGWLRRLRASRLKARIYIRLSRRLQALAPERQDPRVFYIQLSQTLKRYLAERLELPMLSATTAEVADRLTAAGVTGKTAEAVREILWNADQVKFSITHAPGPPAPSSAAGEREMSRDLSAAQRIARSMEELEPHVEP